MKGPYHDKFTGKHIIMIKLHDYKCICSCIAISIQSIFLNRIATLF